MDFSAALERIHDHIENDRVENAVMACLRVARSSKDFLFSAIFLRELYPSKNEIARALFTETQHLNDEAKKFISSGRWSVSSSCTRSRASILIQARLKATAPT